MPVPTLTSTIRDRLAWSISDTHLEGRAVDIRSNVYSKMEIIEMITFINDKYAEIAGTSPVGKPHKCLIYEEIIDEDGIDHSHFHLQIRREIDLSLFLKI